ncbi:MAG: hypothetical protein JSW62_00140 [Thermoplasmatales archaeon]|nr:MAG: hypothetical protein JSW62_00140 [Thermoplasmatales archaeon]
MKRKKYFGIVAVSLILFVVISPALTSTNVETNNKYQEIKNSVKNNYENALSYPTSATVFTAPYTEEAYHWNDTDQYACLDLEATSGCYNEDGDIVAYAHSYFGIGNAEAEAMQQIKFSVGRSKTITITGILEIVHGVHEWAFLSHLATAVTYGSYSYDNFDENYDTIGIDPPFTWEDLLPILINIIGLVLGSIMPIPPLLPNAIRILASGLDTYMTYQDLINWKNNGWAEEIPVSFSFLAGPGTHSVWVGVKAKASTAGILEKANSTIFGKVKEIIVDGISPPDAPELVGQDKGHIGEAYEFVANTIDYNYDPVQFKFDWGDGTTTEWSEFDEESYYKFKRESHTYQEKGIYTIKVYVRDKDGMEAEGYGSHTISIDSDLPVASFISSVVSYVAGFNASNSYDPDGGDVVGYRWDFGVGEGWTDWFEMPEMVFNYQNYVGGSYTVKLQVKDDEGDIGEYTQVIAVRNKGFNKPHLILFQRYHNLFLILQKILQVLK